MRPKRKARRYSTIWMRASQLRGIPTSSMKPSDTRQPLAIRTVPPHAMVAGSSRNGRTTRWRLSRWSTESASTAQKSGERAALIPALSASALPPFSLSMTRRFLWSSER